MMKIKEALICFVCSVLSATAVGQQIYVKQPYDGYAEGQTIYLDSDGGKYVLHPDGRTRMTPMITIDGCDIGLKWAPIAGIYWCPTYTSNPDLIPVVVPPTDVTPPDWVTDWNNYQIVLAQQAAAATPVVVVQPPQTPVPAPVTNWGCNHNPTAYAWDPTQGGNCDNHGGDQGGI